MLSGRTDTNSLVFQRNEEMQAVLRDYQLFRLCREFGWTMDELDAQPADVVTRWLTYMAAEDLAKAQAQKDLENDLRRGGGDRRWR